MRRAYCVILVDGIWESPCRYHTQVRIAGVAEIVEDTDLKKEIVAARPFLKPWVEERGYDLLVVFRVTQGQAAVWTMAANFEPTRYQKL